MLRSKKILVADPSVYMGELTATMLRSVGAKTIAIAKDSAGVLTALAQASYDVLVIDDQLAPIDALELTRRIRTAKTGGDQLPIIMVFAEADRQRIEQARDAGVTEFIKKPMSAKILDARILQAIDNPRAVVHASDYVGPDRRRRTLSIDGEERRNADEEADGV
ncbi:MAG TPA: response regulator [Devosiaceae bacterium]|nr:response regulator [Devosiaceae bacterium]